ncbi:rhodanese-like domain-containing protein [Deinococcus radiophilus]|uniref:Rhodanese-like domain-containing protein n=1 Tax=Deinococcus radiophilus TaxID=32062 RepID=A0A431W1V0_9DEIO|nr:rhodanese-like domain-containing protein [Deinococcus radiophilus]RTR29454.1 rhodanese-like domain-containing protein [Deinococcus radiophilus]
MPLPSDATLLDLRPQELRFADPLERILPSYPVTVLTLQAIEHGEYQPADLAGPVVVVCERGVRSPLAAQLLQADGVDAQAYPGGVPALKRSLAQGPG